MCLEKIFYLFLIHVMRFFNTGLFLVIKTWRFGTFIFLSVSQDRTLIKLIAIEKAIPGVFFLLLELVDLVFTECRENICHMVSALNRS